MSDEIYTQRMMVVRLLAMSSGCNYGVGKDNNTDWKDEWRNVVYVDLPQGQVSWHIAKADMHLFEDFPEYEGVWDGKFSGKCPDFIKSITRAETPTNEDCAEALEDIFGSTLKGSFSAMERKEILINKIAKHRETIRKALTRPDIDCADMARLQSIEEGLYSAYETGNPVMLWDYVEKLMEGGE